MSAAGRSNEVRGGSGRSLTSKLVPILFAVVALYALSDYAIQRVTITRSFQALEQAEARRDLDRVVEAIRDEEEQLDRYCLGRATTDDTCAFVVGTSWPGPFPLFFPPLLQRARHVRESQFGETSFERDQIDLLYVCDPSGRVCFSHVRAAVPGEPATLRDFPKDRLGPHHPLLARGTIEETLDARGRKTTRRKESWKGIFVTERGPMLVSARPIVDAHGAGPVRGTVIAGRFLDRRLVQVLSSRTKVLFQVWPLRSANLPAEEHDAMDLLSASAWNPLVREVNDHLLHVYVTAPDFREVPALLIRADLDRRVSAMGGEAVRYALLSTVTVGLLMLLVLIAIVQRTVLQPIRTLTHKAVAIGRGEEVELGSDLRRRDEIGILSREFGHMLAKLSESRAALVRTARAAGMSEIATGILHNVGNVLNSVNVSASMVGRQVRGLCVDDLEALSRVLAEHASDLASFVAADERGRHLQPFVDALAREMRSAQLGIDEELGALTRGVEHIRELINSQQGYAGRGGMTEPLDVEAQLEEALGISEKALAPDPSLEIVRDYAPIGTVLADRHKLLEILVNLVQNARQAMNQHASPVRRITLSTRDRGERVRIEVRDSGPGIAPENLLRIFNLGFTTRADGHGVGLHASANAAKEMSGRLSVESEGLGRGAAFTLDLPKRPVGEEAVAR